MNVLLWILQVLLALVFFAHGWLFTAPPAEMAAEMNTAFAPALRIFIGVAELLGATGLLLTALTRVQPWLTTFAATALAVVVGSATVLHLMRGEISTAITTAILCVLLLFVAYMRGRVKVISPRAVAA